MDYFSKNKITVWIIVILVLLNLFTLSTIWFNQFRVPERPPRQDVGHRRQGLKVLEHKLNLSDEQIQVFAEIRQRHFEKIRPLQKEIFSCRQELMNELYKSTPDTGRISTLARRIGEKEILRERAIFEHFMEMKSACNPEQKEKFEILLRELMAPPEDMPHLRPRGKEFGYGPDPRAVPFFNEPVF
jgi:Spy/CpxP family protein refolding chaperone